MLYWGYMGIMEKKMETTIMSYMGGYQNYGPFLVPCILGAVLLIGIQKGTISLTTTHMYKDYHPRPSQ